MTHSVRLIILNTTKIGEKSLVLHCLSPDWGRRSFLCSVSKGVSMAMFLPLNIVEGEVVENAHSDLWRVRNLSLLYPLNGIRSSVGKNSITMFMSEVLYRSIHEGAYESGLFEWLRNAILTLDALESDYANFHLRFLLEYASVLGFSCHPALFAESFKLSRHEDKLRRLLEADYAEALMIPMSGESRNEIAGALIDYIAFHTETRLNIRSLSVLRELFNTP